MEVLTDQQKMQIEYNITNKEQDLSYSAYQKKFMLKNLIIKSVVLFLLFAFFIQKVIFSPNNTVNWVVVGLSFGYLFFIWYNPYKMKKNMLLALLSIEDDRYEFSLYEDYFSIKTILPKEDLDENEENQDEIPPRIVDFSKDHIEILETNELFIIILKKQTIYTIPKRCLSEIQQEEVREAFLAKIIEERYYNI